MKRIIFLKTCSRKYIFKDNSNPELVHARHKVLNPPTSSPPLVKGVGGISNSIYPVICDFKGTISKKDNNKHLRSFGIKSVINFLVFLLIAFYLLCTLSSPVHAEDLARKGRIIIKFTEGGVVFPLKKDESPLNKIFIKGSRLRTQLQNNGCSSLRRLYGNKKVRLDGIPDVSLLYMATIDSSVDVINFAETLQGMNLTGVEYIQPNYIYELQGVSSAQPNDPLFAQQYSFEQVNLPPGWEYESGSSDVIIAVLDNIYGFRDYVNYSNVSIKDDFPDGKILDEKNILNMQPAPAPFRHGYDVASIIGAVRNNGNLIAGIAGGGNGNMGCRILPIHVTNDSLYSDSENLAKGIELAIFNEYNYKADIINISLGSRAGGDLYGEGMNFNDKLLLSRVWMAFEKDVLIVASRGNTGDETPILPAAFYDPLVVSVGAVDGANNILPQSSYNSQMDVAAPGTGIYSLQGSLITGTSYSAAFVSGIAALLKSKNKDLSAFDLQQILKATAWDILTPGFDVYTGHGLVDAKAALQMISEPNSLVSLNVTFTGNDLLNQQGESVSATFIDPATGQSMQKTAIKYTYRKKVNFPEPYRGIPKVWNNPHTVCGWTKVINDTVFQFSTLDTSNVDSTSAEFTTYVYKIDGKYYPEGVKPEHVLARCTVAGEKQNDSTAVVQAKETRSTYRTIKGKSYIKENGTWYYLASAESGNQPIYVKENINVHRLRVRLSSQIDLTKEFLSSLGISNVDSIENNYLPRCYTIVVPKSLDDESCFDIVETLDKSGQFEWINITVYLHGSDGLIPNDSLWYNQSNLHKQRLNLPRAWSKVTGDSIILVALIDCGVELEHEDLKDNLWSNPHVGEFYTPVPNSPQWKIKEAINGINFVDQDKLKNGDITSDPVAIDTSLVRYHGTACAGILCARTNNAIGVSGVAGGWGTQKGISLMVIKAAPTALNFDPQTLEYAIRYAIAKGARIISMSIGVADQDSGLQNAIEAADSLGIIIVAPAGNGGKTPVDFPARYPSVISVGAVDSNDILWYGNRNNVSPYGSNYGKVDFVAPGGGGALDPEKRWIWTTTVYNRYMKFGGTSAAVPHVAGFAALLLSRNPNMNKGQVYFQMQKYAKDLGQPKKDEKYGWGRINVGDAFPNMYIPDDYAEIETGLNYSAPGDDVIVKATANPYMPASWLHIPPGVTLKTEPNVTIKMKKETKISVEGKLQAGGTTFAFNDTGIVDWDGIYLESGVQSSSFIKNSTIRRAFYGVWNQDSTKYINIQNCTFDSCVYGIYSTNGARPDIASCTINHCRDGGIRLYYSSPKIQNTTIDNNFNAGLFCECASSPTVWNNNIRNNGSHGFANYWASCGALTDSSANAGNVIRNNAVRQVYCAGHSNVTLGYYDSTQGQENHPAQSTIMSDSAGYLITVKDTSDVLAQYIYWGSSPPDTTTRFDKYSGSNLYYKPWWDGVNPFPTRKTAVKSPPSIISSYDKGRNFISQNKYHDAITNLTTQIDSLPDSRDAKQALVFLNAINTKGNYEGDFLKYLKKVVSSYPSLRFMALQFAALEMSAKGYYGDAKEIYDFLMGYKTDEAPCWALYQGFHFYLYNMGDITKSKNLLVSLNKSNIEDLILQNAQSDFEFLKNKVKPYQGALKKSGLSFLRWNDPKKETAVESLPLTYALKPAYPNPFNPTTTIRFEIPEPKKVSIKIYNVLGQLVEILVNESYPAGKFEKQWNARRYASGIYFVQMRAGNFVKTTKVTLLK